ncbi:MAG: N-acetylmuramoyl-L-alanine amidase [Planctomycetota bacterium]|jgi:predicted outer membrane repeat protein
MNELGYHTIDCCILDEDENPVPNAQVVVLGIKCRPRSSGDDGSVSLIVAPPRFRRRVVLYATTTSRIGVKSLRLDSSQNKTDAGSINVIPLRREVFFTFFLIQIVRLLHSIRYHLRYVVPVLLLLVYLCVEFSILTPVPLEEYVSSKNLHLIRKSLNTDFSTDSFPVQIRPGQTVRLLAKTRVKDVTSPLVIPESSRLVISPGITLRFSQDSGITSHGSLLAKGTDSEKIVFTGMDPGKGWKHIAIVRAHEQAHVFRHCVFEHGRGSRYYTPESGSARSEADFQRIESEFRPDENHYAIGGAMLIYDSAAVVCEDCTFANNAAAAGGAIYVRKDSTLRIKRCAFENNVAVNEEKINAPGGAVYVHSSHLLVLVDSRFENNRATSKWSCGGAIYVGFLSDASIQNASFVRNAASHAGGAVYCLNQKLAFRNSVEKSVIFASSRFYANLAGSASAVFIDQGVTATIVDSDFVSNVSGYRQGPFDATGEPTTWMGGSVIVHSTSSDNPATLSIDEESYRNQANGVVPPKEIAGNDVFWRDIQERKNVSANLDDRKDIITESPLHILFSPMDDKQDPCNPCFESVGAARSIDTIVLHHVSAINWYAPDLQDKYSSQIQAVESKIRVTRDNLEMHKYDWELCKAIFLAYGVASHYLIARDGKVIQLVEDNDIAYHAGRSKMPGDGAREGVNTFSIGIELISSHPDDDPAVESNPSEAYTAAQYQALDTLLGILCRKHDIKKIVGHDEIAPGRKKDPGPLFDWKRVRNRDMLPLAKFTAL